MKLAQFVDGVYAHCLFSVLLVTKKQRSLRSPGNYGLAKTMFNRSDYVSGRDN